MYLRYVKDEAQKVLVRDKEIKKRWREYFDKLFNGSSTQDLDDLTICTELANLKLKRP